MDTLSASLTSGMELRAVVVPVLICLVCMLQGAGRGFNRTMLAIFLVGTAQSLLLSHWKIAEDGALELHIFPACAMIFALVPKRNRPTWQLGYCVTFFSQLATDALCGARYASVHHCASVQFFCGIGGAGFLDGLFLVPAIIAISLWVYTLVESSPYGNIDLLRLRRLPVR